MAAHAARKTFILGLDGLAHSFLADRFAKGGLPNLWSIASQGSFKRMDSVYPTVSSVAWASYMTGVNPGRHGILGFVDRDPSPFKLRIPTAADRKAPTLWHKLSAAGKKVIVINVPLTYPPEQVNGILISDFLCTDIDKVALPSWLGPYLRSKGYIIDVDAWLARESKEKFAAQIMLALDKRFEVAFDLMEREMWDFFQLHIMETDRLFHFFYADIWSGSFSGFVNDFFDRLDAYVGTLRSMLSADDRLLVLSDHGFCAITAEVQLNRWLEEQGFLRFNGSADKRLERYDLSSAAYSLIPGRIFINLEGREEKGSVRRGDYEAVRRDIKARLLGLTDPRTEGRVIDRVFYREEIYDGPFRDAAADIIVHPKDGYDIKAKVGGTDLFERTALEGMHTFDDAFAMAVNLDIGNVRSIQDPCRAVLEQ